MKALRLGQPDIAWHSHRDRIAEVGCFLGLVTGTLAKLATDVKLMMQTEIGEAFEPAAPGRGSSTTMPQKRNPVSCVYIHVCASVVRQHVAALLEAMVSDHERASGLLADRMGFSSRCIPPDFRRTHACAIASPPASRSRRSADARQSRSLPTALSSRRRR